MSASISHKSAFSCKFLQPIIRMFVGSPPQGAFVPGKVKEGKRAFSMSQSYKKPSGATRDGYELDTGGRWTASPGDRHNRRQQQVTSFLLQGVIHLRGNSNDVLVFASFQSYKLICGCSEL